MGHGGILSVARSLAPVRRPADRQKPQTPPLRPPRGATRLRTQATSSFHADRHPSMRPVAGAAEAIWATIRTCSCACWPARIRLHHLACRGDGVSTGHPRCRRWLLTARATGPMRITPSSRRWRISSAASMTQACDGRHLLWSSDHRAGPGRHRGQASRGWAVGAPGLRFRRPAVTLNAWHQDQVVWPCRPARRSRAATRSARMPALIMATGPLPCRRIGIRRRLHPRADGHPAPRVSCRTTCWPGCGRMGQADGASCWPTGSRPSSSNPAPWREPTKVPHERLDRETAPGRARLHVGAPPGRGRMHRGHMAGGPVQGDARVENSRRQNQFYCPIRSSCNDHREWADNPSGAFTEPDMVIGPRLFHCHPPPRPGPPTGPSRSSMTRPTSRATHAHRTAQRAETRGAAVPRQGLEPGRGARDGVLPGRANIDPNQPIIPPWGRTGRRAAAKQAYSMSAVDEYGKVIDDIYDFAEAQAFEIDGILQRAARPGRDQPEPRRSGGPGRRDLLLQAADPRGRAAPRLLCHLHGQAHRGRAGQRHAHPSFDHGYRNGPEHLFRRKRAARRRPSCISSPACRSTCPPPSALLAPYVNSYRRYVPDFAAPITWNGAATNRTTGLRVPISGPEARRLENAGGHGRKPPIWDRGQPGLWLSGPS